MLYCTILYPSSTVEDLDEPLVYSRDKTQGKLTDMVQLKRYTKFVTNFLGSNNMLMHTLFPRRSYSLDILARIDD